MRQLNVNLLLLCLNDSLFLYLIDLLSPAICDIMWFLMTVMVGVKGTKVTCYQSFYCFHTSISRCLFTSLVILETCM